MGIKAPIILCTPLASSSSPSTISLFLQSNLIITNPPLMMNQNFQFHQTKSQHFNPFVTYNDHHHFPSPEIETMAAVDEQLPPLEDINHTQISIPQINESTKFISNSNSKSKSTSAYSDPTSPASVELLNSYRSKIKHVEAGSTDEIVPDFAGNLSTVDIIKLAAEKFIDFSTQRTDGYTMCIHPYGSSAITRLSVDEMREVELVFQLLNAAENVGRKQFEIASKFLTRCGWVASDGGTPVERVVYYLCEALQIRIGKEMGIPVPMKLEKFDIKNENPMGMGTNLTFLACHQTLPFNQVLQLCGIQAILDQVGRSKKVHLIDIHIRSGVQWIAMMQALAERKSKIKLLKLTAFATSTSSDVQIVGETGKRLESFAKTLRLPFLFKILVLSDITEVKEEQFDVQDGEVVAVYCHLILRTMVSRPQSLENLMRVIRTIKPIIIVVAEVEANHNSTSFVNRFTEALFFYGAFFDCFEACMSPDDAHRTILEGIHVADGMQNVVAAEGHERVSRSVYIDTWRLFFARFGMVELKLSYSCVYQAKLVLQQFSCGSSCTLENNGKCLVVGWKGTSLYSLSTWKFV